MDRDVVVLLKAMFHALSMTSYGLFLGSRSTLDILQYILLQTNLGEKIPERFPSSMLSLDVIPHLILAMFGRKQIGLHEKHYIKLLTHSLILTVLHCHCQTRT